MLTQSMQDLMTPWPCVLNFNRPGLMPVHHWLLTLHVDINFLCTLSFPTVSFRYLYYAQFNRNTCTPLLIMKFCRIHKFMQICQDLDNGGKNDFLLYLGISHLGIFTHNLQSLYRMVQKNVQWVPALQMEMSGWWETSEDNAWPEWENNTPRR